VKKIKGWRRGDVVSVQDLAHPDAVCVLTSDALENQNRAWLLVDGTCLMWISNEWVESHSPMLLVRCGTVSDRYVSAHA
jgi:hypothetical protein